MPGIVTAGPADGGLFVRYAAIFIALYGGYGALSPFLPLFLDHRGISAREIAWLLALATLVRMVSGPLAGRLADRRRAVRPMLVAAAVLAGLAALGHLAVAGYPALLAIGLAYAVVTAPLAPFSDTLALSASEGGRRFVYGRVRGAGSAAFIAATGLAGWLVPPFGTGAAIWLGAGLFLAAGLFAGLLASPSRHPSADPMPGAMPSSGATLDPRGGFSAVIANPGFRRVVLAASLVMGAHAMHDAFAMILWSRSGIAPGLAGLLWSEAVAAEIVVFLLAGPWILARLSPGSAIALAAGAGALRWGIAAQTVALPALAAIQALHGLTFALLHLACLKQIGRCVPPELTATALTLYGPLGLGLSSAIFTLAAGPLVATFGAAGFWVMSAASLLAIPVALQLARADRSHAARLVHR